MMQAHHLLYSLPALLALVPLLALANEQCWFPDGRTLATDIPCNSDGGPSACCSPDAFCLENGLCLYEGVVSRGSCTDQTWGDPACAQYCRDYDTNGGAALQPCDPQGSTWACGVSNNDCINDQDTFILSSANGIVLRASQVASLQTGSSSATLLSPTSVLQDHAVHNSSGSDTASSAARFTVRDMAGVGAGIGVPLLLALLGAIFVILRQRTRLHSSYHNGFPSSHSHQRVMQNGHPPSRMHHDVLPRSVRTGHYQQAYYKPGQPRPVNEMDGLMARQELEGDRASELK